MRTTLWILVNQHHGQTDSTPLNHLSVLAAQAATLDLNTQLFTSASFNDQLSSDLLRLEHALLNGVALRTPISGLYGRILRGNTQQDFLYLSEDPRRRVVFLLGPEGLQDLTGMNGYQMLLHVGHTPEEIYRRVVLQGKSYKLVVFPVSQSVIVADWDGVVTAVSAAFPEHAEALARHRHALEYFTLREIEQQAGFEFSQVSENDPRFMSSERFAACAKTLWQTRAFLYHIVQLRALFKGDGSTYTANGERGVREYMIANTPIAQVDNRIVFDLAVQIPER